METGTVFLNNKTQAIRLPTGVRLPDSIKKVSIRSIGKERIISPCDNTWDSFFLDNAGVSDDFLEKRASQSQKDRELFDA